MSFFVPGDFGPWRALGAGRAETNTSWMIFRSMASIKMSNRSKKVVLDASHDSFEVGALRKSRSAHKISLRPNPFPKHETLEKTWNPRKIMIFAEILLFRILFRGWSWLTRSVLGHSGCPADRCREFSAYPYPHRALDKPGYPWAILEIHLEEDKHVLPKNRRG